MGQLFEYLQRPTKFCIIEKDEGTNDTDKSFVVTDDELWGILWIYIKLTTTATVGDRQIEIQIVDDQNDIVGQFVAGLVQAASLTRYYHFGPHLQDLTAFRDTDKLYNPIPEIWLIEDMDIRVWDNNAVDAAADDMMVYIGLDKRHR